MNRFTSSAADFGPRWPASRAKPGRSFRSRSVGPPAASPGSTRATGLPPSAFSTAPVRTARTFEHAVRRGAKIPRDEGMNARQIVREDRTV